MQLTDSIMRASNEAMAALVGNALTLAAAGKFGLLPCSRPFQLSLDIVSDNIEVKALSCHALTRGGSLIDVEFDTRFTFTGRFENRAAIPSHNGSGEWFLTISVCPDQWEETTDGFEEPIYKFDCIGTNSPIDDNTLPIAHIINTGQNAWQEDRIGFVPPCLFVSSHQKYQKLLLQFVDILKEVDASINDMSKDHLNYAFSTGWPMMQQIMIETDKGRDLMTPMTLLGNVQRFVAAFSSTCKVNKYLTFRADEHPDYDDFRQYILKPYNIKDVYTLINEGLALCDSINRRIDSFAKIKLETPKPKPIFNKPPMPTIANENLTPNCSKDIIYVPVINTATGAKVMFSIDGGASYSEATIKDNNLVIAFKNRFRPDNTHEPDEQLEVKLKAVLNGNESDTNSYVLRLHKNFNTWIRI